MDPNAVINRLVRLAKLDTTVFDEVRDDERELVPALVVAAVACILAGLGSLLYWQIVPDFDADSIFLNTLIFGSVFLAAMYGVAALVTYLVLVQMYRAQVDLQALIRTMGYAAAPLALSVLMFIPVIYPLFAILPFALLYVMMIYAAQSASGAESTQVVISTTIGLAVMVLVLGLIAASSGGPSGFDFNAPMGGGIFGIIIDLS